ncbi:hypothetical protein AMS68_007577 [Peltaster fructicola]|uniref:Uncharacterized protein n=1 Tax=Peltaster fructicola TaxID=286661 RepID=A0A6H0Y634_9PEZI|nr:hypothetical protein AMS68_007577 [Peltaster fructicola]
MPSTKERAMSNTSTSSSIQSYTSRASSSWDYSEQVPWTTFAWTQPRGSWSQTSLVIRQQKSKVEIRQQEELQTVPSDLLGLMEPRPSVGVAQGGIEEVLYGEL